MSRRSRRKARDTGLIDKHGTNKTDSSGKRRMLNYSELFYGPTGLAIAYCDAQADVHAILRAEVIKDASTDFDRGWNAAIARISKRTRILPAEKKTKTSKVGV